MINKSWAAPLNFQVKLTRPPKWNKNETICTMKLYCTRFTGCKNPNSCQFSVLIKYDNCSWICVDNYRTLNMCHNGHTIDISPAQEASMNASRDKEADTEEMIDAEHSQPFKKLRPDIENESVKTNTSTPSNDIGLGLFGYLENYRKLIG